jgi:hypothetical protein
MKFQALLSFVAGFAMVGGLLLVLRLMAHKPLFAPPKALSKTNCGRTITAIQNTPSSILQSPPVADTFSARTLMEPRDNRWQKNDRPQTGTFIPNFIDRRSPLTSIY